MLLLRYCCDGGDLARALLRFGAGATIYTTEVPKKGTSCESGGGAAARVDKGCIVKQIFGNFSSN